jgi:hypothetical protein
MSVHTTPSDTATAHPVALWHTLRASQARERRCWLSGHGGEVNETPQPFVRRATRTAVWHRDSVTALGGVRLGDGVCGSLTLSVTLWPPGSLFCGGVAWWHHSWQCGVLTLSAAWLGGLVRLAPAAPASLAPILDMSVAVRCSLFRALTAHSCCHGYRACHHHCVRISLVAYLATHRRAHTLTHTHTHTNSHLHRTHSPYVGTTV